LNSNAWLWNFLFEGQVCYIGIGYPPCPTKPALLVFLLYPPAAAPSNRSNAMGPLGLKTAAHVHPVPAASLAGVSYASENATRHITEALTLAGVMANAAERPSSNETIEVTPLADAPTAQA
jgi:hypothetical protein